MTLPFRSAISPILIFAAGFAACASGLSLALRANAPMPDMLVLSPKLDAYRATAKKFDTIFIGTSRTFYHIVPDEVEAGAAAAGCPKLDVFNFGVFGLTGAEQDWLIQEVIAAGGSSLRTVVIEDPLPNSRDFGEATSDRARYFLAPSLWPAQIDSIRAFPESLAKRAFRGGVLGWGLVFDLSGTGRASAAVFPPAMAAAGEVDPAYLVDDGFEALGSVVNEGILARRAAFLGDAPGFAAALSRYGAQSGERVEARADYLARRLAAIEAHGLNAALYISPDLAELDRTPRTGEAVRALPDQPTVLNFNRPNAYPQLFQRDLWYDFSHLGEAGARRLSFLAGEELCAASPALRGSADAVR